MNKKMEMKKTEFKKIEIIQEMDVLFQFSFFR